MRTKNKEKKNMSKKTITMNAASIIINANHWSWWTR